MPAARIETDRLVIRRFSKRDTAALNDAIRISLPDLNEWLPWARTNYQSGDAGAFIRDSLQAWKEDRAWDYTIRESIEPDRHLGNISMWTVSKLGKIAELGYWVRSDETSRGICTEAANAILDEAFRAEGFHKVIMRIAVGNHASTRVAEKLGFTREGILREELLIRGNWVDHSLWSILDREFKTLHRGNIRSTG
ncbi:MAG: GNAT family protein [Acidimicrobiia bacterium]